MTDIVFRPATLKDLRDIIELLADDELGKSRETLSDPVDQAYITAFECFDKDPNQLLIAMCHNDGRVLGTLQLSFLTSLSHRGATRAQIESVRVASSERGQGLGEKMFTWAIAEARSRGCRVVQLTTDQTRTAAHSFYKKLGFIPSHLGFKMIL